MITAIHRETPTKVSICKKEEIIMLLINLLVFIKIQINSRKYNSSKLIIMEIKRRTNTAISFRTDSFRKCPIGAMVTGSRDKSIVLYNKIITGITVMFSLLWRPKDRIRATPSILGA